MKRIKKLPEHERRVNFFNDILTINRYLHMRSLNEAQIIFLVSTFVFSFILTRVISPDFSQYTWCMRAGLVILVLTSFIALFRVIFILRPTFFERVLRKKRETIFNPFFFRTYKLASSEEEFINKVHKIYDSDKALIKVYGDEAFSMGRILEKHYNIINGAAEIMITGLSVSILLITIALLFKI